MRKAQTKTLADFLLTGKSGRDNKNLKQTEKRENSCCNFLKEIVAVLFCLFGCLALEYGKSLWDSTYDGGVRK